MGKSYNSHKGSHGAKWAHLASKPYSRHDWSDNDYYAKKAEVKRISVAIDLVDLGLGAIAPIGRARKRISAY